MIQQTCCRVHTHYLFFLFFKRASLKFFFRFFSLLLVLANGFSLLLFLTNSFLSVRNGTEPTMAVARRVSLSDLGFLCSRSIALSVSSSPLRSIQNINNKP
uniref:Uncharacterized protein n=1 Tax=Denticeps clupeoides TaxID=299321 RepID=A0AAY4EHI3_9TELE